MKQWQKIALPGNNPIVPRRKTQALGKTTSPSG